MFILLATNLQAQTIEPTTNDTTEEKKSFVSAVTDWYADNMGLGSVTLLMTIESSFIPFPSEVIIPPAVYVAEEENSSLNITDSYFVNVLIIILFGTLGALLGAIINYFLSMWLGRPIIYAFADSKLGHILLLNSDKIKKAEDYFNEHGRISTFVGRLIPAIRQLISIPAGLARMPFGVFIGYTALGAFVWNCVLALIGYIAHGQKDLIDEYSHELSIVILALFGLVIIWWLLRKALKRSRK